MSIDEKLIAKHQRLLGLSRDEAIQLIEDDKRIDRGEKLFELDPELAKGAKKARQAQRKPTAYQFNTREKKPKPEKVKICTALQNGLRTLGVNDFTVTNEEREFTFTHNGTKYKVTLACPRS